jgi:hypothetical protein
MRFALLFGIVSILGIPACGKKAEAPPPTQEADTQTVAAEDTGASPAPEDAAAADSAAPAPEDAAEPTPGADAAAAADATTAVALPLPVAPSKKFDDMTEDEMKDHMKTVVVPTMRPRFQQFDAEEFAKVNCTTCHGPGAKEGKFEMPNPDLPKLPGTKDGWDKLAQEEPKALEFMKNVVVPAMLVMLAEEPFDPATQKGFGCFSCHTAEQM